MSPRTADQLQAIIAASGVMDSRPPGFQVTIDATDHLTGGATVELWQEVATGIHTQLVLVSDTTDTEGAVQLLREGLATLQSRVAEYERSRA